MRVLAIESTCDETGACLAERDGEAVRIIAETKASEAEITAKYGGVVPEVVAREQAAVIIPVIQEAMAHAHPGGGQNIDAVAVSYGPGLIGSLLIGVETAKALAWAWEKPLLKVNHLVAHVFANWIGEVVPELPAVALIVSGGHTDLVLLKSPAEWRWIGGTRDDAVGEAFDKAARAMGLPYPGGPQIQVLSEKAKGESKIKLPRPMINDKSLEMSFSGLKTAVVRQVAEGRDTAELAREFNRAAVEVLVTKTGRAVEVFSPKSVILAGGVAANKLLREQLAVASGQWLVKLFVPELKYCTDNAAMIAAAALMRPVEAEILNLRPEPTLAVE